MVWDFTDAITVKNGNRIKGLLKCKEGAHQKNHELFTVTSATIIIILCKGKGANTE